MRQHPEFKVVAKTLWARYTATVRLEAILACWPCIAPTAWELHCASLNTNPIARPQNLPVQRPTAPRLATRERDREANQTQDDSPQQYGHLKRAYFREQRSRIRDDRWVDTTAGGLACAQTTPRQPLAGSPHSSLACALRPWRPTPPSTWWGLHPGRSLHGGSFPSGLRPQPQPGPPPR